jgi:DNA-binding MarR family transcriptional regulator
VPTAGRSLLVKLTAKRDKYRENLIKERRAVEEKLRKELALYEICLLLRLLKRVANWSLSIHRSTPLRSTVKLASTGRQAA